MPESNEGLTEKRKTLGTVMGDGERMGRDGAGGGISKFSEKAGKKKKGEGGPRQG